MNREIHVPLRESLKVRFLWSTRPANSSAAGPLLHHAHIVPIAGESYRLRPPTASRNDARRPGQTRASMSLLWIQIAVQPGDVDNKKVRSSLRERVTLRFTRKGAITPVSVKIGN